MSRSVAAFAEREKMFRRTKRVLLALSGGVDSVATLLVLLELRERFDFEVIASHFDHKLRPESAADMERVRDLCRTLDVECLTGEGDVADVARRTHKGVEETARTMRYQFLAFVAGKEGADCIATGHTADDQAETVLMRVIRGSGVRGIRGMLPVAAVPGAEAQRLARPLLEVRRADTAAICREAGIEPVEDASNADTAYARNHLRHETLAVLRKVNPSIESALIGLAQSAREAFGDIERASFSLQPTVRGPVGATFPLARFADLPTEAATLVVERESSFYSLRTKVNRTCVRNLRGVLGRGTGLVRFGEAVVEVSAGQVRVGPELLEVEDFPATVLNVPGSTRAGPWRVDVSTGALPAMEGALHGALDASRTTGALRLRLLLPGDRMLYRGIDRKVADVLANAKVPRWERLGMVAVADSTRVHCLFGSTGATFEAVEGEAVLHVRISQLPGA